VLTAPTPSRARSTVPAAAAPVHKRRRRSSAALAAAFVFASGVAVLSGAAAAWVAAAVVVAAAAAYAVALVRLRHLAGEREMSEAFVRDVAVDWSAFERDLAEERDALFWANQEDELEAAPCGSARAGGTDLGLGDLGRFLASYALGWALTPVVVLLGRRRGVAPANRLVERVVRAQQAGRSQSLRLLAAGLVATAGVTAAAGLATAVASAPAAYASTVPGGATYTVQPGDTLSGIAARYGTTVAALASANSLSNPNLIFPGQLLILPAGSAASGTYTVRAGDTLSGIAARFGTTVAHLAALNRLANPNVLSVGEVLRISGNAPAVATPAPAASGTYTVQAGDTLSGIAARFGTTVAHLVALNRLANPNVLSVGEVLRISGNAPAPAAPAATVTTTASPAPAPAPAPQVGESAAAAIAVRVALEQVGKPYVWGGAGPNDFDCSGLVMYAYEAAGIDLPHYSVSQYEDTTRISESQLEPGDLVFYDNYSGPQPGHVAMYIGNGQVVAANEPGTNVQTQPLSWDGTIIGFGRVN